MARNCLGQRVSYRGAWAFTRAHFFDSHAVSIGKTVENLGSGADVEIVEQHRGPDYWRLVLGKGKLLGAQAVGKPANRVGFLLGAMWRRDDLGRIRASWDQVEKINSPYPWQQRVVGGYLGLS